MERENRANGGRENTERERGRRVNRDGERE